MAFPSSISSWYGCFLLVPPPSRISLAFLTLMFMRLAAEWVTMSSRLFCCVYQLPALHSVSYHQQTCVHDILQSSHSLVQETWAVQTKILVALLPSVWSSLTCVCQQLLIAGGLWGRSNGTRTNGRGHRVVQGPSISWLQLHGLHWSKALA